MTAVFRVSVLCVRILVWFTCDEREREKKAMLFDFPFGISSRDMHIETDDGF